MARYIYYCGGCEMSFEALAHEVRAGGPGPATCVLCGSENTRTLYRADDSEPAGGCCPPGTGCCGTPGSS